MTFSDKSRWIDIYKQGVPKKVGLVENGHWGPLGRARVKSRVIFKNSRNFQSFEQKNFNILSKKAWEIEAQGCLPSLKNYDNFRHIKFGPTVICVLRLIL